MDVVFVHDRLALCSRLPEFSDVEVPGVAESVWCRGWVGGIVFVAHNVVNEARADVPRVGCSGPSGTADIADVAAN